MHGTVFALRHGKGVSHARMRGIRVLLPLLCVVMLNGCSAVEGDPAGTLAAVPVNPGDPSPYGPQKRDPAREARVKAQLAGKARCQEVTSWYEGFLTQAYIRDGAERELDKNLEAARAKLAKGGLTETTTGEREINCRPSYPIGIKEWRCFGKAELCVKGARKS